MLIPRKAFVLAIALLGLGLGPTGIPAHADSATYQDSTTGTFLRISQSATSGAGRFSGVDGGTVDQSTAYFVVGQYSDSSGFATFGTIDAAGHIVSASDDSTDTYGRASIRVDDYRAGIQSAPAPCEIFIAKVNPDGSVGERIASLPCPVPVDVPNPPPALHGVPVVVGFLPCFSYTVDPPSLTVC